MKTPEREASTQMTYGHLAYSPQRAIDVLRRCHDPNAGLTTLEYDFLRVNFGVRPFSDLIHYILSYPTDDLVRPYQVSPTGIQKRDPWVHTGMAIIELAATLDPQVVDDPVRLVYESVDSLNKLWKEKRSSASAHYALGKCLARIFGYYSTGGQDILMCQSVREFCQEYKKVTGEDGYDAWCQFETGYKVEEFNEEREGRGLPYAFADLEIKNWEEHTVVQTAWNHIHDVPDKLF